MAVSDSWTDPVANHDLSLGNLVNETIWDQVMSNILHADRGNEPSLTNKSGSSQSAGAVVIVDSSNDSAFTTTTTADVTNVLGVVMETIANNAAGRVAVAGLVTVNVQGNVTRGNYLATSTTAGRAKDAGSAKTGATFAQALTSYAGGGAGTVTAIILPSIQVDGAPANLIAHTTDASAPSGWAIKTTLYGRVIVGFNTNIGSTVATALTTLEDRTHTHTGPSHQHTETVGPYNTANLTVAIDAPFGSESNSVTYVSPGSATSATASIPLDLTKNSGTGATGATSATMPYMNLLPIQKS